MQNNVLSAHVAGCSSARPVLIRPLLQPTCRPCAFAICTAALPTPPAAACTSTRCPGCSRAVLSAWKAVSAAESECEGVLCRHADACRLCHARPILYHGGQGNSHAQSLPAMITHRTCEAQRRCICVANVRWNARQVRCRHGAQLGVRAPCHLRPPAVGAGKDSLALLESPRLVPFDHFSRQVAAGHLQREWWSAGWGVCTLQSRDMACTGRAVMLWACCAGT